MEFNEEIVSPPYPSSHATIRRVRDTLQDLRGWLQQHRLWANEYAANAGSDVPLVPSDADLPVVPEIDQFLTFGIVDLHDTYLQLRSLREYWDHTVRTYEDEWDCPQAAAHRIKAIRHGVVILANAFVPSEKREAMDAAVKRRMKETMERMIKGLSDQMQSAGMPPVGFSFLGDDEDTDPESMLSDEELDNLFNPVERPDRSDDNAPPDNQ